MTTPPSARACTSPRILLSLGESSLIARSRLWCFADDLRLMTHSPASTRAVGLPCLSTPWKPSISVVPGPERGSRYPAGVPNKPPAASPTTPPIARRAGLPSGRSAGRPPPTYTVSTEIVWRDVVFWLASPWIRLITSGTLSLILTSPVRLSLTRMPRSSMRVLTSGSLESMTTLPPGRVFVFSPRASSFSIVPGTSALSM